MFTFLWIHFHLADTFPTYFVKIMLFILDTKGVYFIALLISLEAFSSITEWITDKLKKLSRFNKLTIEIA